MNVLGVIVARGGSKGIVGKNLVQLGGKSLLERTAECAHASESIDRLICSTDNESIADAARACGVEVPFMRPKNLASDTAPTCEVIRHALRECRDFDSVVVLQPTNPLRIPADIDGAVELLDATENASAVIGYSIAWEHPSQMVYMDARNKMTPVVRDSMMFMRRQELQPAYIRNGNIYISRAMTIEEGSIHGRNPVPYVMPRERCWTVDIETDLIIAEALLKNVENISCKSQIAG